MTAHKSFRIIVAFTLSFLLFPFVSTAQGDMPADPSDEAFNPTDMIMHHIGDAHGWHFFGSGEQSVTLPLPVILYTDNGLVTFMSSEFHHDTEGEQVVEKDGMRFVNYHETIYQLNEGEDQIAFNEEGDATNAVKPFDFSITKNVAAMFLTIIVMFIFFFGLARHHKRDSKAPRGINSAL